VIRSKILCPPLIHPSASRTASNGPSVWSPRLAFTASWDSSRSRQVSRLLAREEQKIAAQPGHRTAPATLRKLAESRLVYRVV
jgi:hypothetical protein